MGLTRRIVRDARPGIKVVSLRDDDPVGLALRIWPKSRKNPHGKKVWTLDYRAADGRSRRINIGTVSEFELNQARDRANELLRGLRRGEDPLDARTALRERPTVAEGVERFVHSYMPGRVSKGRMAERTAKEYRRQLDRHVLPAIGRKAIADVAHGDIEKVLKGLPPVMHNRVHALLSTLFGRFEDWRYRPQNDNPAKGIERAVEQERDRTLSESELSALGKALDQLGGNIFAVLAIRLAALTGLRIGEIRTVQWEHIDFETHVLTMPSTKTGRRLHTLPSAAMALLVDAPRLGPWVIVGKTNRAPLDYSVIRRSFKAACEVAEIENARLHDLRRTLMTQAAASGIHAHFLRDMLGHKTTAMADRYIRQAGAPLVEARERMGASMAAQMAGESPGELVDFKGAKSV